MQTKKHALWKWYQYTRLEKGETFHSHPLGKQSFCRQIPSAVTMTRSTEDFLRSLKRAQTTQEPVSRSIPLSHEKDCESFSVNEFVVWCMWPEISPPIIDKTSIFRVTDKMTWLCCMCERQNKTWLQVQLICSVKAGSGTAWGHEIKAGDKIHPKF